jgi:KaiC/GvpD/RAD55 family RecA-like ATPase
MRVSTGVPGFDRLVGGGLTRNRLYVVSGPPGSGKTTFCTQFVTAGAEGGEKCLYLSMHESKETFLEDMSQFEFGLVEQMDQRIHFMNVFADRSKNLLVGSANTDYRSNVQRMTARIAEFVDRHDIERIVIDSTLLLRNFFSGEGDTFFQFITGLKQSQATTMVVSEVSDPDTFVDEHYLAHGVIVLRYSLEDGVMQRGIQIVKMRGCPTDGAVRSIEFTDAGLEVQPGRQVEA